MLSNSRADQRECNAVLNAGCEMRMRIPAEKHGATLHRMLDYLEFTWTSVDIPRAWSRQVSEATEDDMAAITIRPEVMKQ